MDGIESPVVRVVVLGDMEGVAGICRWEQVSAGKALYEEGRRLYTEEVNAAVRGACAAGASEVVVMDCHGAGGDCSFNSLIPDALDERCEFVVQSAWTEHTEPFEDGCDAALMIGMHAMAGAERGVMSHTVSSTSWHSLRFNGTTVGEVGINAALCGIWGCPVALVTGDDVVGAEAATLLGPGLATLAVKRGLGRFSARHQPPARARAGIERAARDALGALASAPVYDPGSPCTIEVELATPDHADRYRHRAGVTIAGGRTVTSTAATWLEAWRQFYL
jgi:D-amino peptidase